MKEWIGWTLEWIDRTVASIFNLIFETIKLIIGNILTFVILVFVLFFVVCRVRDSERQRQR